jgi:hypothetical protein
MKKETEEKNRLIQKLEQEKKETDNTYKIAKKVDRVT